MKKIKKKVHAHRTRKKQTKLVVKRKNRSVHKRFHNPQKKEIVIPVAEVGPVKKRRKRRSKSSSKLYFDENTENAIVIYNNLPDWAHDERNRLFEEKIKYPFEKLVENIFNTFKFSYFETSPLDVQKETLSHLVACMHRFDKRKGKAFSFFSIIAKHFLIFLNNTNYKRFNQNVDISEERDENTVQLQAVDNHSKEVETQEFMRLMVEFWENNINRIFNKQKDLNIANAVIELFRSSDRIDSFNKKALYLYIREISSCKTQQITKVINKMKLYQSNIQRSYSQTGHVCTGNYMKV